MPHPVAKGKDGIARYSDKPADQEEIFLTNGTKSSPSVLVLCLLNLLIWNKSKGCFLCFGNTSVIREPTGSHWLKKKGKRMDNV